MTAYIIAQIDINDADLFRKYGEKVSAVVERYGGRYIVRGGSIDNLEGALSRGRLVVIEFESQEAAKLWYNSPEYAPLIELRQKSSEGEVVVVEGL
tara:strand:- start:485 stop:772 length:288 start_codon:yes stop_codon:yes gene_type:complete